MEEGYEFTVVQDLLKEVETSEGVELVLLKKNLQTKWYCRDLNMISSFAQTYNDNGNIRIHHTRITAAGEDMIVKLPYSKAKELFKGRTEVKGFKNEK